MELGSRIREFRKAKNMKLNELAVSAGISRVYLSDIERNNKIPPLITLERICNGLNLTLGDFFAAEKSELEPELRHLVGIVRKLTPAQREHLQKLLEAISKD